MTEEFDFDAVYEEVQWLAINDHFAEKPATIKQFVEGEDYLNIGSRTRASVLASLVSIFGEEVDPFWISVKRRAMYTGGIGVGKTTFASIALPYMVHWVSCLKDPQGFFELLPGSRIAFMQMSTSSAQAKDVIFGDIKARVENSKWFMEKCEYDKDFKNSLRFPKDIWVLPGNSQETTFEGYNILAGILDEGDSHKITEAKSYAEAGYDTINSRIASRFTDPVTEKNKGLLMVIGQMKSGSGFMAKKKKELEIDSDAHVTSLSIWESYGWERYLDSDGNRRSFYYDCRRKIVVPDMAAAMVTNKDMIEVPLAYFDAFTNDPSKAMRDLAGIPPETDDPFISLLDRIDLCMERWQERYDGADSPVSDSPTDPLFADWFFATDSLKRAIHIDIGVSADGDALGMAMGHVPELVDVGGEIKPHIVIDFVLRIKAAPGTEVMLSDVRNIIYDLRDERKFKIKRATMDGFQSTDTRQQLNRRRIFADYLSVDKTKLAYEDLRESIYERRLDLPPYFTYLKKGDGVTVQILRKELVELTDTGRKVDHPARGSKDVADAVAGVVHTLMGNAMFRRGSQRPGSSQEDASEYEAAEKVDKSPVQALGFEDFKKSMGGTTIPGSGATAPLPPGQPWQGLRFPHAH